MLWGFSLETWDRWSVWAMWVAAISGGIAVLAGLFTGYVGHRIAEIAQRESDVKIAQANAQGEEAKKLAAQSNEKAVAAELRLEELRRQVAPRQLDRAVFLDVLRDQPSTRIEILYLRDDPECFNLAQQFWAALKDAHWDVAPPEPVLEPQHRSFEGPIVTFVNGQPSGVTVVANSATQGEADARLHQARGEEWEHTPFTVLSYAVLKTLGRSGSAVGGIYAPPQGILRLVVAPR
jgi:F0F1-type ATP synthase epsilon subunit